MLFQRNGDIIWMNLADILIKQITNSLEEILPSKLTRFYKTIQLFILKIMWTQCWLAVKKPLHFWILRYSLCAWIKKIMLCFFTKIRQMSFLQKRKLEKPGMQARKLKDWKVLFWMFCLMNSGHRLILYLGTRQLLKKI